MWGAWQLDTCALRQNGDVTKHSERCEESTGLWTHPVRKVVHASEVLQHAEITDISTVQVFRLWRPASDDRRTAAQQLLGACRSTPHLVEVVRKGRTIARGEQCIAADDHRAACQIPLLTKGMRRAHLKTVLSGVVRRREVATVVQQHRNISATLFQLLCELVHRSVGIDSTSDTQVRLTWL